VTPLQLRKAVATLIGCHPGDVAEVVPVAWKVTTKCYEPGTNHIRKTEYHRVELSS
jgi:hypothetical protein